MITTNDYTMPSFSELIKMKTWEEFLDFHAEINLTELYGAKEELKDFVDFMEEEDEFNELGIGFAKKAIEEGRDASDVLKEYMVTIYNESRRYSLQSEGEEHIKVIEYLLEEGATGLDTVLYDYPKVSISVVPDFSDPHRRTGGYDYLYELYYNLTVSGVLIDHFGPLGKIPGIEGMDWGSVVRLDIEEDDCEEDCIDYRMAFLKDQSEWIRSIQKK